MAVRLVLAFAIGLAVAAVVACVQRPPERPVRRLTGTCEGACDLYLACKGTGSAHAASACISECRQVFDDEDSLRMFESLSCDKVIGFVEGPTGRSPSGVEAEAGARSSTSGASGNGASGNDASGHDN
jgi:hypothetical protein